MIKKITDKKKPLIANSAQPIIANMQLQFIRKAKAPWLLAQRTNKLSITVPSVELMTL